MKNKKTNNCIEQMDNYIQTHNSIINEYNHAIERTNKLEFKISILVAFIGVILGNLLFVKIENSNIIVSIDIGIFLRIVYICILALFGIVLVLFLYLLFSTKLYRIDNKDIVEHVVDKDNIVYYSFTNTKYIKITNMNNNIISKKYNLYDTTLKILIVAMILLFIFIILNFIGGNV